MTTETNKEFEEAVINGFKGTRSEYIASKKNKRDYLGELGNICLTALILGTLINVCSSSFVDYYIEHKVSRVEHWTIIQLSVVASLMTLYNVFKRKDAK